MTRKDFTAGFIIGIAVGLLVQPILANVLSHTNLTLAVRLGIFMFFAILGPLALWICYPISKLWKGFYQFSQFAAVGTLNSFIDIGMFNLETYLFPLRHHEQLRVE
jgi:putative flippase GtrA